MPGYSIALIKTWNLKISKFMYRNNIVLVAWNVYIWTKIQKKKLQIFQHVMEFSLKYT